MYVYTILCEGDNYYVGTTTDLVKRVEEHISGTGSSFTQTHKPVALLLNFRKVSQDTAGLEEDLEVKKLMKQHGVDKVRGGTYSTLTLTTEVKEHLNRELNHAASHSIAGGPVDRKDSKLNCTRCHRNTHKIEDCKAKTTYEGEYLCSGTTKEGVHCRVTVAGDKSKCKWHNK